MVQKFRMPKYANIWRIGCQSYGDWVLCNEKTTSASAVGVPCASRIFRAVIFLIYKSFIDYLFC